MLGGSNQFAGFDNGLLLGDIKKSDNLNYRIFFKTLNCFVLRKKRFYQSVQI